MNKETAEFVYLITWFQGVLGIRTTTDISKLSVISKLRVVFVNIKSGLYAKYTEDTMLLFVYNMKVKNYYRGVPEAKWLARQPLTSAAGFHFRLGI